MHRTKFLSTSPHIHNLNEKLNTYLERSSFDKDLRRIAAFYCIYAKPRQNLSETLRLWTNYVQAIRHQQNYEYTSSIFVEGFIYGLLAHITEVFVVEGVYLWIQVEYTEEGAFVAVEVAVEAMECVENPVPYELHVGLGL